MQIEAYCKCTLLNPDKNKKFYEDLKYYLD